MKPEQITAWALDEASAAELQQLEAELRVNPTTQKAAEDTKAFCHFLLAELRDDSLALTDEQRERLKVAAARPAVVTKPAGPAMLHTGATARKAKRAGPTWGRSIGLRLGLAACLTAGCVVAWQQYDQQVRRRVMAMKMPEPEGAKKTFQVRMPSPSSPGMGVPGVLTPADVRRMTSSENVNQQVLPGATQPTTHVGLPVLTATPPPGAPASVLSAPSTMTVADKVKLGRLQDEMSYGVSVDTVNASGGFGVGGGTVLNTVGGGAMPQPATGPVTQVIPGSLVLSGETNAVTGSVFQPEGGIVSGTGAPSTINGGRAEPPLRVGAPLLGGVASTGSIDFPGGLSVAAPPAWGLDSTAATLRAGYDYSRNPSEFTKTGPGAFVITPPSPPPVMLSTVPGGPVPAMIGGLTTGAAGVGGKSQVEAVHKGLLLANGSAELGNYDVAISQYQDVVRVDPYNAAARRGMEEVERKRNAYFRAAQDHQRSKMLAAVDESWEEKVPVAGEAVIVTGSVTGDFASTLPINNQAPDARYFATATTPARPSESKPRMLPEGPASEAYQRILENELKEVAREPLSTFSIDVDTAAYANVRRFLNHGLIPPADAVRIEELINYFPAAEEGPAPGAKEPFGVRVEMAPCPWQPLHRMARIAVKGRELGQERKASNLVFLVDVSGSMNEPAKLPLVQQSLRMLTEQLGEGDRVSMVVYAGSSGLALPPTNGEDKQAILAAIDNLKAGGSTHGSAGIYLAYEQAVANFIKGGVNRVILCTDGDFNVGVNTPEELEKLITKKARSGVFLSVLGFGSGNLKDQTMEVLADKGNGNYAYIDSLSEARKVLVEQMGGTLVTIAKDVKIQVEFNPAAVRSYRLIGYENRLMAKEDFNDDTKDAGEIGAGHSVVALYEVVPANLPPGAEPRPLVDNLRYQQNAPAIPPAQLAEAAKSGEVMTVKLRYKEPDSSLSKLIEVPAKDEGKTLTASTEEFKFSAAVAGFGLLLRDSAYKGTLGWETVRKLALDGKGSDKLGYRGEFLQLIDKARGLKETRP